MHFLDVDCLLGTVDGSPITSSFDWQCALPQRHVIEYPLMLHIHLLLLRACVLKHA
jgi:hypothetical protein